MKRAPSFSACLIAIGRTASDTAPTATTGTNARARHRYSSQTASGTTRNAAK
jgi:hypothetical protein